MSSHALVCMTCQKPERSGFPSEVRGTWAAVDAVHRQTKAVMVPMARVMTTLFALRRVVGGTQEKVASVFERDRLSVDGGGAVLRAEPLHDDLDANREVGLAQAAPQQCVRRARLDGPVLDFPVGALDIDVDPTVRIDPFHLAQ